MVTDVRLVDKGDRIDLRTGQGGPVAATHRTPGFDLRRQRLVSTFARDRDADGLDVPDPYYAGTEMFDSVLGMIESATRGLFRQLEPALRLPRTPRTSGASSGGLP